MSQITSSYSYIWALVGVFAAFHFTLTMIPVIPIAGLSGGFISLGLVSAPLAGFILGPLYGVISVFIGSFLAISANPALAAIGPLTPIATAAGALIAGLIRARKPFVIPLIYIIGIAIYLIGPLAQIGITFIWFHIVTLGISLIFVIPKVSKSLLDALNFSGESNPAIVMFASWLLAIVAIVGDHVIGSSLGTHYYAVTFGLTPDVLWGFFAPIVFVYPIERLIASLGCAALLFAIGYTLAKEFIGIPLLPGMSAEEGILELDESEIH
ncbi:MAG: hypothetical protein RTU30_08400 [Candidatus Thorarchaeota archaeon]